MKALWLLISALVAAFTSNAMATPQEDRRSASAAVLYSYTVLRSAEFERGYKAHLDWHAAKKDHLVWYGWQVVSGPRIGTFVDGTFGASFAEIDRRPVPREDGADFARNVGPFVNAAKTEVFALWPAASTDFRLEDHLPSPFLDVFFVRVEPGGAQDFEKLMARLRIKAGCSAEGRLTWYRAIAGTQLPLYVLMVPRTAWSELGSRTTPFPQWLARLYGIPRDGALIGKAIAEIASEVWAYRADLSYFPEDRESRR